MSRVQFKLPDLGEGTVSSEVVQWRVKLGDVISENQPLVELATEKAVVEVTSPVSGRVVALHGEAGMQVPVGAVLVEFETDPSQANAVTPQSAAKVPPKDPGSQPNEGALRISDPREVAKTRTPVMANRVMASPVVRRLAREASIDLSKLPGTGPNGRIERRDIEAMVRGSSTPPAGLGLATASSSATTATMGSRQIPVIGVRRVIAKRMVEAVQTIPHITYVEEVDVTDLEAHRAILNGLVNDVQSRFSILPFVIKALCETLKIHPRLNAHYHAEREVIEEYDEVHVGIATNTPDGLKVPVLRHADMMDLDGIRAGVSDIATRARLNQVKRSELTGSTITITSLGKLGGLVSTPIINSPELAIIGLNRVKQSVEVYKGQIAIRSIMNLSSSFDHRFIDGYNAALFIQDLKANLERIPAQPVK